MKTAGEARDRRVRLGRSSASSLYGCAFLATALVTLGVACGPAVNEAAWTEETRLHDGGSVIVQRRETRKPSGFPDAPRGPILTRELRLGAMQVAWTGDGTRVPLSFEIFEGQAQLILIVNDLTWCVGKPDEELPAEYLVWEQGQWKRTARETARTSEAVANLHLSPWGRSTKDDPRGLITWREKARDGGFYEHRPDTVDKFFVRTSINCKLYRR